MDNCTKQIEPALICTYITSVFLFEFLRTTKAYLNRQSSPESRLMTSHKGLDLFEDVEVDDKKKDRSMDTNHLQTSTITQCWDL